MHSSRASRCWMRSRISAARSNSSARDVAGCSDPSLHQVTDGAEGKTIAAIPQIAPRSLRRTKVLDVAEPDSPELLREEQRIEGRQPGLSHRGGSARDRGRPRHDEGEDDLATRRGRGSDKLQRLHHRFMAEIDRDTEPGDERDLVPPEAGAIERGPE